MQFATPQQKKPLSSVLSAWVTLRNWSLVQNTSGSRGPAPLPTPRFFAGNFSGKTPTLSKFWAQGPHPSGAKTPLASCPLAKIVDPPLLKLSVCLLFQTERANLLGTAQKGYQAAGGPSSPENPAAPVRCAGFTQVTSTLTAYLTPNTRLSTPK